MKSTVIAAILKQALGITDNFIVFRRPTVSETYKAAAKLLLKAAGDSVDTQAVQPESVVLAASKAAADMAAVRSGVCENHDDVFVAKTVTPEEFAGIFKGEIERLSAETDLTKAVAEAFTLRSAIAKSFAPFESYTRQPEEMPSFVFYKADPSGIASLRKANEEKLSKAKAESPEALAKAEAEIAAAAAAGPAPYFSGEGTDVSKAAPDARGALAEAANTVAKAANVIKGRGKDGWGYRDLATSSFLNGEPEENFG